MENKDFTPEQLVSELKTLGESLKEDATKHYDEKQAAIAETIKSVETKSDATAEELAEMKAKLETTIKAFDLLQTRVKSTSKTEVREKSFNENLREAIEGGADKIKNFKPGGSEVKLDLKAVGDMSWAANFPGGYASLVTDQGPFRINPTEQVWLSDIIPGGTTNGSAVAYPRENGGEGDVAVWEGDTTVAKPQIDYDFTSETAYVKWLAGIVRVPREMLDDLDFLTSFIQNRMLLSLKKAENNFILNGVASAVNPVSGLLDVAEAYDGTYTIPVEKIIDAAWGQIVENGAYPSHVVLGPRKAVEIGLTKGAVSGDYSLPGGSVVFQNGRLTLAGLDTVTATVMGTDFLAMDKNQAMFIKKMQPELRMFEQDRDNVQKNLITFRIEERATLAIFKADAFVKGSLVVA